MTRQDSIAQQLHLRPFPSRHSGGGKRRPPTRTALAADGEDEAARERGAALRSQLLRMLGGDARSLDLVLDLIFGRITYESAGLELQWERYKVWRLVRSVLDMLRWAWIADLALNALAKDDGFTID